MQIFNYKKAKSVQEAQGISAANMKFLAGGTTLIDLMKLEVETPSVVVDVNALPFQQVEKSKDGGLRIGAFV
ncbi:MAG: xanthine dehydrogenase family protein subunit M, partial [Proteobacteria bacterium]